MACIWVHRIVFCVAWGSLMVGKSLGQGGRPAGFISGIVSNGDGPIIGVQVWVDGTDIGDVTDTLGYYSIGPVPVGAYHVIFQHIGYKRERVGPVEILHGGDAVLDAILTQEAVEMEAVLVTPKAERFDPGGVTAQLTKRMIQEAPGAAQDVFLVLQTLPGVSSGGDDSKLFVRGGRPEENLVLYDGATISYPFHFDFVGGGYYTVFNSSLVDNVEFYSGGFPARYGDRLSSVLVIENRDGNREETSAEFSLSMADVKLLFEAPISNNASTILTVRRSYFDLLLGYSGFGSDYDLLPFFYDINSKTDFLYSDKHRISLNLLYSREEMSGYFDEPHWEGKHKWLGESWTGALRLRSIYSKQVVSDINLYWSGGLNRGSHADAEGVESARVEEAALKADLAFHGQSHEIHAGIWVLEDLTRRMARVPIHLAYNFEPMYFKSKGTATKLSAYAEDTWDASSLISLNYGIRADHIVPSSETVLSPRVNIVLTPADKLQLSANFGLYSQSPPGYELENNPSQRSRRSRTWGVGVNGSMVSDVYWSLEAYQKRLTNLMTIDSSGNFADEGHGEVRGYELYVRKKTGEKFIGWLSWTHSFAERKEATAIEVAPFDYDQSYMVSAVGQYHPSEKWQLSCRFRYATGKPYTPANGGILDVATGGYYPIVGKRNSKRFPSYHRLDIRIARYFPHVLNGLSVYIETINTYDWDNVVYYVWSHDFSDTRDFTVFPFLPILGIDLRL